MFLNLANDNAPSSRTGRKWLWITLVIVVMLLLLAVFGLPKYQQHLMKSRSAKAKEAVESIKGRVEAWWQTNGNMGGFTMENALAETKLSKKTKEQWNIFVAWKPTEIYTKEMVDKLKNVKSNDYVYVAPYKVIMAVATEANPLPAGTKVWYEGDSNSYHGYGIDNRVEPDWKVIFPNP